MTPEQEAILRDVQVQLRGPRLSGWPELGAVGAPGDRTVVEALAAALRQIDELRTEIGDLETTLAELSRRVQPPDQLPWPLSLVAALLQDPAAVIGEQIARWESLIGGLLGTPDDAPHPRTPALEAAPARMAEQG